MAGNDEEQNSAVSLIRSKFGNGTAGISGQALRTWMTRVIPICECPLLDSMA